MRRARMTLMLTLDDAIVPKDESAATAQLATVVTLALDAYGDMDSVRVAVWDDPDPEEPAP